MIKTLRSRRRDEQGAVLVLAAFGMVLAMIASALSIDLGRLAQDKRNDQKVADMAALDAVWALSGDFQLAALQSATRNDFDYAAPGFGLTAEAGSVDSTGTFQPGPASGATAVRVEVTSLFKNAFASGERTVKARAVATLGNGTGCHLPDICIKADGSALGTVRVGSKLVNANGTVEPTKVRILNKLISPLIGGTVSLDAVGWKGVADATVTFERLRSALGLTAGTTDQALDATITYRQLLDATVNALNADGSPSALAASTPVATIATKVSAALGLQLQLRDLFGVTGATGSGSDVANATLSVLDIVRGGAFVADTDHFVSLDLSATDVGAIPGFNFARVKLGLIEGPDTAMGAPRDGAGYHTMAETSQVRALVEVNLLLNLTGLGLTDVKVPYYLDAGSAQAFLDALQCSAGGTIPERVDVLAVTKAGSSKLATVSDSSLASTTSTPVPATARIVNVAGLVTADTKSVLSLNIPGNAGTMLSFTPDYATASSQAVGASSISLPTVAATDLKVTALVLGLDVAAIALDLSTGINNALPAVKANILDPLYKTLGLSFAGADVWAPPAQGCRPTSYSIDPAAPVVSFPVLVG
ncbi:MAG TPA: hypothetical protein VM388_05895 [Acidimicrobiales bacterium]|jgi:uncharacterized membrane protein|nr:hypothetical protein [Acidimicrobiales bacterium]